MLRSRGVAVLAVAVFGLVGTAGCGSSSTMTTAQPAPSASQGPRAAKNQNDRLADGQLVTISNASITVHTKRGDQTYPLSQAVKVRLDGADATVSALHAGMRVTLFRSAAKKGVASASPAGEAAVARITARSQAQPGASSPAN